MKKVALCFLLLVSLLLASCGGTASRHPFSYVDNAFSLTVRGELCLDVDLAPADGTVGKTRAGEPMAFSAEVTARPLPAGTVMEGLPTEGKAYRVSVIYTAPEAISGLSVTCAYGGQETATTATLTYPSPTGVLTVSLPYEAVRGLLAPVLALIPQGDVSEVGPVKDEGWTVACDNGTVYSFTKESAFPVKVETGGDESRLRMYADPKIP